MLSCRSSGGMPLADALGKREKHHRASLHGRFDKEYLYKTLYQLMVKKLVFYLPEIELATALIVIHLNQNF